MNGSALDRPLFDVPVYALAWGVFIGGIIQLLLAFLDHLALEQVVLISNDTGGAYAQVFTAQHPERVAGLVLSNCDCLDVFPPKNFASLQKMINLPSYTFLMAQLFRIESFLVTPGVMGLLSNSLTGEEVKRLYVNAFIQQSGIRRDFQKVVNSWSVTHTLAAAERLASYPKPVAIIWGEEDKQLFPIELGKRLAAVFQRGEFHPVSGAMTYIQEDQAEVFVTLIQQYLSLNIEDNLSLQA